MNSGWLVNSYIPLACQSTCYRQTYGSSLSAWSKGRLALFCIHRVNWVNSCNDSLTESWWQHHKHYPGIIISNLLPLLVLCDVWRNSINLRCHRSHWQFLAVIFILYCHHINYNIHTLSLCIEVRSLHPLQTFCIWNQQSEEHLNWRRLMAKSKTSLAFSSYTHTAVLRNNSILTQK